MRSTDVGMQRGGTTLIFKMVCVRGLGPPSSSKTGRKERGRFSTGIAEGNPEGLL